MKLLVVEDEALLRHHLYSRLGEQGHVVDAVANAEEALYRAAEYNHDLAVIDLGLPGMSGLDLIRQLRSQDKSFPILILTARGNWQDKVNGLKAGADDYLAKPFQAEELIARLHAIIRRSEGRSSDMLTVGGFVLDENRQYLTLPDGAEHPLTGTEFRLLRCLMARPGQIFSKEQLIDQLYSLSDSPNENTIEAYVKRLRKLIGVEAIETRRGQGYTFNANT